MAQQKRADSASVKDGDHDGPKRSTFAEIYNLEELDVPHQAWPDSTQSYKGKRSYTVNIRGAVSWLLRFGGL